MLSNGGMVRVALLVSSLSLSQSAFLMFHRLTCLLEVEATSGTGVMSDGDVGTVETSPISPHIHPKMRKECRNDYIEAFCAVYWGDNTHFGGRGLTAHKWQK